MKASTVVALSAGTVATGLLAYIIYFDHRRRNDPNFRKALRREHRRQAKAAKEEAEAQVILQQEAIRAAMADAREEGFPTDAEEREAFFMSEVGRGEQLCQEGPELAVDAALCFYKALKVYPSPRDLISIYDKTVPKASQQPVLDILAEMIASDPSIPVGLGGSPPSDSGAAGVE